MNGHVFKVQSFQSPINAILFIGFIFENKRVYEKIVLIVLPNKLEFYFNLMILLFMV